MVRRDFSIEHALSVGWRTFEGNLGLLIGVAIVVIVVTAIPQGISAAARQNDSNSLLATLMSLVASILQLILSLGVVHIVLKLISGQQAEIGDLFGRMSQLLSYIVAAILVGLAVVVGLFLLIVPGIYLALRMGLFVYFIVDDGAGPIAAIQRSWDATSGVTLKLFVMMVVFILINILGLIPCFLGLLITYPVTYLAHAAVYRTLREQAGFGPPALP